MVIGSGSLDLRCRRGGGVATGWVISGAVDVEPTRENRW
jgi:hypothetical protein